MKALKALFAVSILTLSSLAMAEGGGGSCVVNLVEGGVSAAGVHPGAGALPLEAGDNAVVVCGGDGTVRIKCGIGGEVSGVDAHSRHGDNA